MMMRFKSGSQKQPTGIQNIGKKLVNSKDDPPTFEKPAMTIEKLLEYGSMLVAEQDNVKFVQLDDKNMAEAALREANEDSIKRGTFYGQFLIPDPQRELKIYVFVHKQVEQIQDQDLVAGKRDLLTLMVGTVGQSSQHVIFPIPEAALTQGQ